MGVYAAHTVKDVGVSTYSNLGEDDDADLFLSRHRLASSSVRHDPSQPRSLKSRQREDEMGRLKAHSIALAEEGHVRFGCGLRDHGQADIRGRHRDIDGDDGVDMEEDDNAVAVGKIVTRRPLAVSVFRHEL